MASLDIAIRALAARDSFEQMTSLLHRAYAPLAAQGLNFTAATQPVTLTRKRAAEGHCLVADSGGAVVGTVTVRGPYDADVSPWVAAVPWLRDRDTAHLHQLAVDPSRQCQGVGRALVAAAEQWARDSGFKRMALDTAEPALALRLLYQRLGYAEVGRAQWEGKTYCSVVLLKTLDRSALRGQLQTLARYNLWATQRLLAAVQALPEADYRRDMGLFFKSVHGTLNHLLVAEQLIWFRRFSEAACPQVTLDAEAEPDRQRLQARLVEGALSWLPLLEVWPEDRLLGPLSYQRLNGQAVSLPFAAALTHVFNHGTHHRGQVTAALTALGHGAPELDMIYMLQQEALPRSPLP